MTAKASETGTAAGAYAPPAAASGSPDGTPVSLRNLTRAFGATMADRVGVMSNGKLEQVAEPAELYTRSATAFVAEFVGTMNWLPASVAGPGTVTVLGTSCAAIADIPTSGPVDGLVRPEGLTVAPASGGNGIVSGRTFLGAVTRLAVLLSGDTEVRVDLQGCYADLDGLLSTLAVLRRRQ